MLGVSPIENQILTESNPQICRTLEWKTAIKLLPLWLSSFRDGDERVPPGSAGPRLHLQMGSLQIFDRGTFWVLPLTYFYLTKSARVCLFPNLPKLTTCAAAPLVLTPLVRHRGFIWVRSRSRLYDGRRRGGAPSPQGPLCAGQLPLLL